MNPIQIALIGLRIVAIYLIAQSLSSIADALYYVTAYNTGNDQTTLSYTPVLIALFSPAIIGILLWFAAPKLSSYLISSQPTTENNSTLNTNQFQSSVIILIGVFLLATNLPLLISTSFHLFQNTVEVNGKDTFQPTIILSLSSYGLKVLFGTILILGTKIIVRGLTKLRTIGLN